MKNVFDPCFPRFRIGDRVKASSTCDVYWEWRATQMIVVGVASKVGIEYEYTTIDESDLRDFMRRTRVALTDGWSCSDLSPA